MRLRSTNLILCKKKMLFFMVHDPCSLKPFPCINQSIATYFHNIDAYGGHVEGIVLIITALSDLLVTF